MKVSHNEILTVCQKSFEGLGFSPGETSDAAAMIAWLEVHGVAVLAQLCDALPTISPSTQNPPELDIRNGHVTVDAQGASALFWGSLLAEWGVMKVHEDSAEDSPVIVEVRNYCHPIMLLGLVERYAGRGLGIHIHWAAEPPAHGVIHIAIGPYEAYPTLFADDIEAALYARPNSILTLLFAVESIRLVVESAQPLITPAGFADSFLDRRDHGTKIQDEHWAVLNQYAKNILVEATEESRRRGAGETGG